MSARVESTERNRRRLRQEVGREEGNATRSL